MKKEDECELSEDKEPDLVEIFDKMIQLQEGDKKPSFLRKIIYISTAICVIMFVGLMCYSLYKNNLSTESILATFLAFFSIFMSVFFYFKADETSTKFYDSSYKFMKDISVTLGKIEERFGEKLNSLNDKMSHIDNERKEIDNKLKVKEEDKDKFLDEILEKTNLKQEEKEKYRREIQDKDEEIERLRIDKAQAEHMAFRLRHEMDKTKNIESFGQKVPSERVLFNSLNNKDISDLSIRNIQDLRNLGFIDSNGSVNDNAITKWLKDNRRKA